MNPKQRIVRLVGAKGGVGATTTAALLAVTEAAKGHAVLLVSEDAGLLLAETVPNLTIATFPAEFWDEYDLVIIDTIPTNSATTFVVAENSYVCMHRYQASLDQYGHHDLILVRDHTRALSLSDVEAVTGKKVTAVDRSEMVARVCDAGLLGSHSGASTRSLRHVLDDVHPVGDGQPC